MNWQSSTLDQHSTHWPTCSSLYFSSASSLASSSCCARAFASWFPRQVGDSKVCILMRLTNRHMIKPWVYAIPSEKNANMKAPASSSSTCFSAFSAAVCCWSFCTFLLNDSQYFLGTFFTITLLRVFNSWCPNQNVKHTSKVWLCASRTCCWSISFSWRRFGWLTYDCECRFLIMQFYTLQKATYYIILYHYIQICTLSLGNPPCARSSLRAISARANSCKDLGSAKRIQETPLRITTRTHRRYLNTKSARQHHEVQTSCTAVPEWNTVPHWLWMCHMGHMGHMAISMSHLSHCHCNCLNRVRIC